jgi:predicted transcriptional regulator
MNINIYIEDQLEKALRQFALTEHKTRNAIIREAIFEWIQRHKKQEWPTCIRNFKGMGDQKAQRFESFRDELKEPKADPFK